MSAQKTPVSSITFKEKVNIGQAFVTMAQAIATIIAIIVAGAWTYKVFIKERHEYPRANIEQKFSHATLSEQVNFVRVGVELTNIGNSLMRLKQSTIKIRQILPLAPCPSDDRCATNEVNEALKKPDRQHDTFSWTLIAARETNFSPIVDIEPGEKQAFNYEFVIPSNVNMIRISAYFRNESKFKESKTDIGWSTIRYYNVNMTNGEDIK